MALLFAVSGGVVAWPTGAGAAAPEKYGYWATPQNEPQPGAQTVQANPTVPEGGLAVVNDPSGAEAISAVSYQVDGVIPATLVLKVHQRSSDVPSSPEPTTIPPDVPVTAPSTTTSTVPPSPTGPVTVDPTVVHVSACVARSNWVEPPHDRPGAWNLRPDFDPTRCVNGSFNSDATTLTFSLQPHLQRSAGVYDMVLVPDPSRVNPNPQNTPAPDPNAPPTNNLPPNPNTSFTVVFDRPVEDSFTPDEASLTPLEEPAPEPPPEPGPVPEIAPSLAVPQSFVPVDNGVLPAFAPPTTVPKAAPKVTFRTPPRQVAAILPKDPRWKRIMAVALLGALALAWWWVAGQEARGPKLLGSMAGGERRWNPPGVRTGGIGRFARPREGRPKRLL
ncbi:MAG TPA: hypothetical protein VFA94_07210 [Acidimicrobiales bacterium]|nr:hypothetical protein [Acidimicrobiales bacterium]